MATTRYRAVAISFMLSPIPCGVGRVFGNEGLGERKPQSLRYALAVTVGLVTLRSWRAATENPADVVKSN